jgi:hypothetical protein
VRYNLKEIPVRYINLLQDTDKNIKMISLLDGYEDVERVDATYIPDNKILALSMSQERSLRSLPTPGLILEDDCEKFYYRDELEVPDDADIVFLGIWQPERPAFRNGKMVPAYESIDRDWVKVYNMVGSHAIMYVSDKGKDIALKAYELSVRTGLWNDIVLSRALPFINAYAPKYPLFYQTSMEKESRVDYTQSFVKVDDWHTDEVGSADDILDL